MPLRVKIVADDLADEKGFLSKYVGKTGTIIDWKPNPVRDDGVIPVIKLDDGTIVCNKHLWWSKEGK